MILSAGIGSRLKPLTNNKPKALVEVNGKPMLGLVIEKLSGIGFNEIIINVHHHARQIIDYIQKNNDFYIDIAFSEESEKLLDTGGGIRKAAWFFDKNPFLVHNVDVISNIDIHDLFRAHVESEDMVTLAVRNRESKRKLIFDENLLLTGREDDEKQEKLLMNPLKKENYFAFSGIHVIDPLIFQKIKKTGAFSIIDAYLEICHQEKIRAYVDDQSYWYDLGTIEKIKEAEKML